MNAVSRVASVACTVGLLAAMVQPTPAEQSAPKAAPPQATPSGQPTGTQSARAPDVAALTDAGWPRVITSGQTRITVYQPQIDSYTGYHLAGRAAVAVTEGADAPPIYGIVQVSADAHVDKDERLVTFEKITVKSAAFPGASDKGQAWSSLIQSRGARLSPMALERFEAALAVSEAERKSDQVAVKNDPPIVLVSTVPSMLILVDGEPVYRDVKATSLTRVLNTRPLLLKNGAGQHYLKVFDGWLEAPALAGP